MTDVFISYSRKDKAFVQTLHEALKASNRDNWVDWEGIPLTADWWQEIERGIESANTFVFVISPDSISSKVCRQEVDHAVKHNKRLVPIVHREGFEMPLVHAALSKHNWLFFREQDAFDVAFQSLITATDTDLVHVRAHTRLLERAIEWDTRTRNPSLLLRDDDLEYAEHWFAQGTSKEPRPTAFQGDYISTSRKTETARQKADRRKQRLFTAGMGAFALLAIGSAGFAFQKQQEAENEKTNADINVQSVAAQNLLTSNLQLESLIAGIRTGEKVKQLDQSTNKTLQTGTQMRAITALRQVVYGVDDRDRLKGHSESVLSVSFSPDGKALATGSGDNTVKLWDLKTGRELHTLKEHSGGVFSVSFSPDGKTLATGSQDRTVKLWDVQAARELHTLKGHSDGISSVSFSPDGKTLATGSYDKTVKLWDVQAGRELQTLPSERSANKGYSDFALSVSFSPDGKTLAIGRADSTVKLWDVQTARELHTLKGHTDWVYSVSFSSDGKTLATGSGDNTVKLWDVQVGRELHTLKEHSGTVFSVSFSPDGKTLATGSQDQTVKLWDVQVGRKLHTLRHSSWVFSVSFSPDGKTLATGSGDKTVILWNLNLDDLLAKGCGWLHNYLQNNPNVSKEDKHLCDGVW